MSNTSDNALYVYVGQPGLQVSYNGGNLYISGSLVTVAAGTIAVTKNATNYIYLLFSNSTVTANTSGFPSASFPMATVVVDNERPTTVTDSRADFVTPVSDQGTFVADVFESGTALPASAGAVRLAKTDAINFRNNANTADIGLSLNSSDILLVPDLLRTKTIADATTGQSPSFKVIYSNLTLTSAVTGGLQTIKGIQSWITVNASSAPGEIFGFYGNIVSSGAPVGAYGVVGEFDNVLSTPSGVGVGVMGTYDGVTAVTAAPGATGLFSAAVCGQVWDRNTTGPTAVILAMVNGDTNRQAGNHVPAAFRAINRCISFNTGFDYGLDLAIVTPFTRGALVADIRLKTKAEIYTGAAATRNAVRTEVGTQGAVGSVYLSTTAAKMYLKVAIAGADTDWQLVTSSAAD